MVISSSSAIPSQCRPHLSELSKLIATQSVDTRLWLKGEMVRLVDPMIDSILLRLLISPSARSGAQPFKQTHFRPTLSELCQLIEEEKEKTNRLARGQIDRLVNLLFLRLTNKLLVNTQVSELVQPSTSNHQTDPSNAEIVPSTMNNSNKNLSADQITFPPTSSAVTTSPLIKHECLDISSTTILTNVDCNDAPNYDENDQSNNDGISSLNESKNAKVQIDEFEDCVKGICGLDGENDYAYNDNAETGVDMQIGLGHVEMEDQPNASLKSDLMAMPDAIDDANQSVNNGPQIHSVRKSTRNATKQNRETSQTAQPVIEHNRQSIPSSSGLQSSTRKRIQKKVFGDEQLDLNVRKSYQANKRVKLVKLKQDFDDHDEDTDVDGTDDQEDYANNAIGEESIATECTTNPIQANLAQPNRHLQCSHCHKSFDHNSTLQTHLRVHTGERPFHCDQCDKQFTMKSNLTKHQLIHQNIKRFRCNQCDKQFTQKFHLECHLRTHSGERPHQCRFCDKSFAQLITWKRHEQAIHLHVKPYRCKLCGHTATQRSGVIKHIREVHFGLPRSIKQQRARNIIDDRDPEEYIEKV